MCNYIIHNTHLAECNLKNQKRLLDIVLHYSTLFFYETQRLKHAPKKPSETITNEYIKTLLLLYLILC